MGFWDSLFPGSANDVQAPQTWQLPPSAMTQLSGQAMGGINNLGQYNQYGANMGQAQQATQNLVNNPYGQDWMQGAQTAGGMGQQGAVNMFNQGGNLYGGANQIMQTAFDPQNALYDRTRGQVQQQERAGQASRGILTSPYGAGLEDQAMNNFNLDWQDRQLGRQTQGGQAASQMSGMGANMQGAAPGQYNAASAMPYNAWQGMGQDQMANLSALGQFGQNAGNQQQQQIQQWMNLLGVGNQANQTANQNFQTQLQQNQMANNQANDMWKNIGNIGGKLLTFGMG